MTLDMELLPQEVFCVILELISVTDVYSLKISNSTYFQKVKGCQKITTRLMDTFWGVNVKNISLLGRDYSLNYEPMILGLMTVKIFKKFYKYFKPKSFIINSDTSTLNLTKFLLKNNFDMEIVIHLNQKNLMTVNKTKISLDIETLIVYSEDKITIETAMQILNLKNQRVRNLIIHGELNDMHFVFLMLPLCLKSLEVYSNEGVHDVRSLPYFFELNLNKLCLVQCYEVCSHPECVNYNSITSQVKKCSIFPNELAMSPFPFEAIKWCEYKGVSIDFQNSAFFDFEFESVMDHINSQEISTSKTK
jgi:hypothetical protein